MTQEIPKFQFALRQDLQNSDKEFAPKRATELDAGWDVCCAEPDGVTLIPFEHKTIRLGFRMFAPEGWWLELRPRSSSHAKKHLHCLYGVIDEGYENEVLFSCQYIPPPLNGTREFSDGCKRPLKNIDWDKSLKIEFGERIGQVVPIRRQEMLVEVVSIEQFNQLCEARKGTRGEGGFGSTGDGK